MVGGGLTAQSANSKGAEKLPALVARLCFEGRVTAAHRDLLSARGHTAKGTGGPGWAQKHGKALGRSPADFVA